MAKLRPMPDRVVVRPLEQEEVTAGGIFLPDSAKAESCFGEVLSIGTTSKPPGFSVGTIVGWNKWQNGWPVDDEGKIRILKLSEVLVKLV